MVTINGEKIRWDEWERYRQPIYWGQYSTSTFKPKMKPTAKEQADLHWKYVEEMLLTHGHSKEEVRAMGYHYKSAFIHGAKHQKEGDIRD